MLHIRHFLLLAFQALIAQPDAGHALAMLGVIVGVGALVTSLALGRGAQDALEDQLRAAGANLIMVTAGNYQVKREIGNDPNGHTEVEPVCGAARQGVMRAAFELSIPRPGRAAGGWRGAVRRAGWFRRISKTIRWRSTIIPPPRTGWAIPRRGSAPRRR